MRSGKIHEKALPAGRTSGRNKKDDRLLKIYRRLLARLGPQGWWPVSAGGVRPRYFAGKKSPPGEKDIFEICVGAILTQNSAWTNVEKAVAGLNRAKAMNPEKILKIPSSRLEELIRPSGYYRMKAAKLRAFARYALSNAPLKKHFSGLSAADLREELLSLYGIGPETADSIIVYAAGKPSFIADAYTLRIFSRMGFRGFSDYERVRDFFGKALPSDPALYGEYHALIVNVGKNFCRKNAPLCRECPLEEICEKKTGKTSSRRLKRK